MSLKVVVTIKDDIQEVTLEKTVVRQNERYRWEIAQTIKAALEDMMYHIVRVMPFEGTELDMNRLRDDIEGVERGGSGRRHRVDE